MGASVSPSSDQLIVIHLEGGNDLVLALMPRSNPADDYVGELIGNLCRLYRLLVFLLATVHLVTLHNHSNRKYFILLCKYFILLYPLSPTNSLDLSNNDGKDMKVTVSRSLSCSLGGKAKALNVENTGTSLNFVKSSTGLTLLCAAEWKLHLQIPRRAGHHDPWPLHNPFTYSTPRPPPPPLVACMWHRRTCFYRHPCKLLLQLYIYC